MATDIARYRRRQTKRKTTLLVCNQDDRHLTYSPSIESSYQYQRWPLPSVLYDDSIGRDSSDFLTTTKRADSRENTTVSAQARYRFLCPGTWRRDGCVGIWRFFACYGLGVSSTASPPLLLASWTTLDTAPGTCLFPARPRWKVPAGVYGGSPTPRCLSTAPTLSAESQVQTSPILPTSPSPTSVTEVVPGGAADVVQAAAEQNLSDLGLGGYTPVGLVQNLLEFVHIDLGLPWWGAIVTCTVVARCLIFPLIVKGQREAVKINNHMPEIQKFTTRMNEAKLSGDKFEFSRAFSELQLYQKKYDVNPMRGFIIPLAQAPVFISFFIALREMAYLPVPSMQSGGLWWFQDLTAADPIYALPLLVTASMWAILELGAETGVNNANLRMMKTVFRVLPLVVLPFTIHFPTAVFTYWFSSNLFSLAQVCFLQIPAVRTWLRIPKRILHEQSQLPTQEGLIKSLKTGWKNAQAAHQLKERERRMRDHLQLAARGPLRQTFTHNPLLQPEGKQPSTTTTSSKPKSQKPWRDTLG